MLGFGRHHHNCLTLPDRNSSTRKTETRPKSLARTLQSVNSSEENITHITEMPKRDISDSESEDANENSSSEEAEAATHVRPQGVSEYEKQRLSRIAENRARLEALGLPKMASALKRPGHIVTVKKWKKVDDDEEYVPDDDAEARLSSSSEEDGHHDVDYDDDDEDFVSEKASRSRKRKVKKKSSKPKARVSRKDPCDNSHHIDDDDEALKQHVANTAHAAIKGRHHIQEDKGRKKNKKSSTANDRG